MNCGRWLNAWLDVYRGPRFYLEQELRKERERRSTPRQVVIPQKEPRPPESSLKVHPHQRKLLFWPFFSYFFVSPRACVFRQQCTPESPSVKRESSQVITGAEDRSSLSSSLYGVNKVHLYGKSSLSVCNFSFVTFFLPSLRSLSHHEDEEVGL